MAPTEVTVSFGLNFDNKEDKALARIFLLEFVDSRKNVKQPPSIIYHDTNYPPSLTSQFPSLANKKFTNGIIQFTLFENHTKPNFDQPITFLVGFRQFLHYHFHFIKATLHIRMRKRVDTFQRVMQKAKRDQDTGHKVYKQTHGGAMIVDLKEEKKQEEKQVLKLELLCWQIMVFAASMNSTKWRKPIKMGYWKLWNSSKFQSPKLE